MILTVSKNLNAAQTLAEMLHYMGILSHAATISCAASEASVKHSAIIIIYSEGFFDLSQFIKDLEAVSDAPIFIVSNSSESYMSYPVFPYTLSAAKLYEAICRFATEQNITPPGIYTLAGIDASVNLASVRYFDRDLPFTRTESMIIRYLIYSYPDTKSAEDILKYSFKRSRMPASASVRTHISSINKKFCAIFGRPLISSSDRGGYSILTAELAETKKSKIYEK